MAETFGENIQEIGALIHTESVLEVPVYISFVVPIYNVSAYLDDCVQSLCKIRNPQVEILLVNDGSTDDSLAICRKYAERDVRVRVINQANRGVSASRNRGIKSARGKWLCFVDGDDCLSDDFDNKIIGQIDDNIDMNCFGYRRMENSGEREYIERNSFYMTEKDMKVAWMRILNKDVCQEPNRFSDTVLFDTAWAKFIKREKLLEWKVYFDEDVSWGEDLLFNFKLLQRIRRTKVIDCTGYYYRINAFSVTRKYDTQAASKFRLLVRAMGEEVEKTDSEDAARQYQVFILKQLLQSLQRDMLNPQNPKTYSLRRKDYCRLRYGEEVVNALHAFPYEDVRPIYKLAIGMVSGGSFGLLCFFYRIKQWREENG